MIWSFIICTPSATYKYSDKMKEMGRARSTLGEDECVNGFGGKSQGKKHIGRPRYSR
jgi:hypothetical protein